MVSQIQKFIDRLSVKEKKVVKQSIERIIKNDFEGLDIKKMTGHSFIYRIRKGDIRIIFEIQDKDVSILKIERRSEKTYRDF